MAPTEFPLRRNPQLTLGLQGRRLLGVAKWPLVRGRSNNGRHETGGPQRKRERSAGLREHALKAEQRWWNVCGVVRGHVVTA